MIPNSVESNTKAPGAAAGDRPATLTVERPITDGIDGFGGSTIVVDGEPVGKLRRGRPTVLSLVAGDHLITVFPDNHLAGPVDDVSPTEITEDSPATIRLRLGPGEKAELICESNQPRLNRMVWCAFWVVIFYVAIGLAGDHIPASKPVVQYLAVPMLIALLAALPLGFIGLALWIRRAYKSGAFTTTVVSLKVKSSTVDPAP